MLVKRTNKIKASSQDRAFFAFNNVLLILAFLLVTYPLIYVVACSFSSSRAVVSGQVFLWPVEPTLIGYQRIFENKLIMSGYANSIFYTIAGTLYSLVLTLTCAFSLSRSDFCLRKPLMGIFAFTMLFSGGLIPSYLLVSNLGLINTRLAMILPTGLSVYNLIVTRTFFENTIPNELLDAARVDGCSDFRFFGSIVLPLSKAIIAVMALFYAVGIWNSYFNAMIYLTDEKLFPLQIILRQILVQNKVDVSMLSASSAADISSKQSLSELLKYALIVVSSVPMMIIYPFVQKYFVKGVMIGAVKG
ncbi:MAG: carbohydrate ABC transporter permease [Oscillospiraceae bacterium]